MATRLGGRLSAAAAAGRGYEYGERLPWDAAFLASGGVLVLAGRALVRAGRLDGVESLLLETDGAFGVVWRETEGEHPARATICGVTAKST